LGGTALAENQYLKYLGGLGLDISSNQVAVEVHSNASRYEQESVGLDGLAT
jgi:FlaG/FlaF family flagellin (archaellin)